MTTDTHAGRMWDCRACGAAERAGVTYWEAQVQHVRGVELEAARRRVALTMGLPVMPWQPEDVIELAATWRYTLPDGDGLPDEFFPRTPPVLAAVAAFAEWCRWWAVAAPRTLRVMTAFMVLFMFSYGYGWAAG
jgi:hypothetical protein